MGIPVLIIGKSGLGKSTSLRNFAPDEIALINVSRKPLPFKKKFECVQATDCYDKILTAIQKAPKDSIVIDDAGYLIVNMFMAGHSKAGAGNAIFGFYNKIADSFWNLIERIKDLPENRIVYIMMHESETDLGAVKPKTIGKLLDEKVCIEGMFTICLRACIDNKEYKFSTHSDGFDPVKTPIGMFDDPLIPNDLKIVDTAIRQYYEIETTNQKGGE